MYTYHTPKVHYWKTWMMKLALHSAILVVQKVAHEAHTLVDYSVAHKPMERMLALVVETF